MYKKKEYKRLKYLLQLVYFEFIIRFNEFLINKDDHSKKNVT